MDANLGIELKNWCYYSNLCAESEVTENKCVSGGINQINLTAKTIPFSANLRQVTSHSSPKIQLILRYDEWDLNGKVLDGTQ